MWTAILGIAASLIPMIIKLILYLVDKKANNEQVQAELLKFIANIEHEIPIKVNERYREQLGRIKEKIQKDRDEEEKMAREISTKI